jgi:hypothetical protein
MKKKIWWFHYDDITMNRAKIALGIYSENKILQDFSGISVVESTCHKVWKKQ